MRARSLPLRSTDFHWPVFGDNLSFVSTLWLRCDLGLARYKLRSPRQPAVLYFFPIPTHLPYQVILDRVRFRIVDSHAPSRYPVPHFQRELSCTRGGD